MNFTKDTLKMKETKIQEDGFPGGIGIGLDLPGGYINGAPTGSNEQTIKELVLNNITDEDFESFVTEYFESLIEDFDLINEDDSGAGYGGFDAGSGMGGNSADGVLDDQLFRSPYLPGWAAFDTNGENYASIVGYTMIGHGSADHIAKTGNIKLPVQNPGDENGELHRVIHPSKGEDYAKEKIDKWEMYPFNQRPQNFFQTPDVSNGAASKSNMIKESVDVNVAENEKVLKHFVGYCIKKLKLKEEPKIQYMNDDYAEQQRSLGGYNPESKTIVVVTQHRMMADVMRTLAHELVHRKQDELGLIKDAESNGATGSPTENVANAVAGIIMRNYGKLDNTIYLKRVNENLLMEGGAAGHLAHPFEDEDLTFNDMKEMINRGLIGGLDKEAPVSEKLDGQNIAFTVKNSEIRFGRNKGHVKNAGENSLDVNGIAQQFAGRGGIEKAFKNSSEDLQAAVKKLSPEQVKKMFGNGSKFMSLEIILPETQNVIPYGKNVLVMHGTIEYNKEGEQIGRSTEDAKTFAQAVQKVGADKQKTFGIEGPREIVFNDADTKEYAQKAKEYSNQLTKVQKKYKLTDNSKLGDYRREWWHDEVYKQEKENGLKFTTQQALGLITRFADGDKSFGVKDFKNPKQQQWFKNFETNQLAKSQKQMINPIEMTFLNSGAEVLKRVSNFLSSNNPKAANELKKETLASIKGIKDSKDPDKIAKLQTELERLNSIGIDKVVPSEGVVFQYNGRPYKFTGAFAPINQINGTFKFDKPKKKEQAPIAGKEEGKKDTIAVFSGRFQPFHTGHYSIYKALVDKFGKDNVYIASSNAQDPIKSPFPFKDKKDIMTKMFGIPIKNVVQVKNPYAPVEVLDKFPPDTKYVTAVSQKDAERLEKGGKYFHNFDKVPPQKRKGYGDAGYFIVAPEMQLNVDGKNISGTQLRATFGSDKLSIPEKKKIFTQVYPKFDKDVFTKIVTTTKKAEAAKNGKTTKIKPVEKPKQIKIDPKNNKKLQKVLQTKIKNPVTGNTILVKSALKYDNSQAVKKMAMTMVKQALGGGKVKTNNIFE